MCHWFSGPVAGVGPRASKTTADLVSTNVGIISFVWLWISHARMLVDKNLRQVLRFIMLFVYYVNWDRPARQCVFYVTKLFLLCFNASVFDRSAFGLWWRCHPSV